MRYFLNIRKKKTSEWRAFERLIIKTVAAGSGAGLRCISTGGESATAASLAKVHGAAGANPSVYQANMGASTPGVCAPNTTVPLMRKEGITRPAQAATEASVF